MIFHFVKREFELFYVIVTLSGFKFNPGINWKPTERVLKRFISYEPLLFRVSMEEQRARQQAETGTPAKPEVIL